MTDRWTSLLCFLLIAAPVQAQVSTGGSSSQQAQSTSNIQSITEESILIGPGDAISIQVFDTPEMTQTLHVTDAGTVSLLSGGKVKVAGRTPSQAARGIENQLIERGLMLHPRVLVTVVEFATQKVSILGEVKSPGAYTLTTPRSVLEVLALSGGLNDYADRKILIQRHGSKQQVEYFLSNAPSAAFNTAVTVDPGDTVFVPRAGIVYVLGDVRNPAGYTITTNDGKLTVLQLVARANGLVHTAAAPHSKLIHKTASGYQEIAIDLRAMQEGKIPDVALAPDDILYVPFSYARSYAIGAASIVATAGSAAIYRF